MKFILTLVLSRMRREKKRLAFALLAIAASSCLVVWTIGGFQALFFDESAREENYLGEYDLRVAPETFGVANARGGQFAGPTSRSYYEPERPKTEGATSNVTNGTREIAAKAENDVPKEKSENRPDGSAPALGNARGGGGRRGRAAIPSDLIRDLRQDENVAVCDEVAAPRMYVYAPGMERSILEDDDPEATARPDVKRSLDVDDDIFASASGGVDPELRRKAFAAFRATMGTPMGMGSTFLATTAAAAPFELQDGRWFRATTGDGPVPREAVMTARGAKKFGVKVGDPLILLGFASLIGQMVEYQLEIVGIVDDPDFESFYISRALGEEIAESANLPLMTEALYLKLRGSVDAFRDKWSETFKNATPAVEAVSRDDLVRRRLDAIRQNRSFQIQAASGALLASLAALLIVFTALNTSVDEDRRLIAFYRVSGLTRAQVSLSILIEGLILAIPGWIAGMIAGWSLVLIISGKATGLNLQTAGFSFRCTVVGGILAALFPMFQSARVKPLEALGVHEQKVPRLVSKRRQTRNLVVATVVGLTLARFYVGFVDSSVKSGSLPSPLLTALSVLALAVGVAFLIPLAVRAAEIVLLPPLAFLLRFDPQTLRREFSGNSRRVVAVSIALSVGGGLFVMMQIWGYSMLAPFLPKSGTPDAFVAFLPTGLRSETVDELKALPTVDPDRFLPIAVEQAAFAEGSVPENAAKSAFANVVFFGVDVDKAFGGKRPMIGLKFLQGNPEKARLAMRSGRGVVVTDSLSVDYGINAGDALKVVHPREPGKVLEYPVVGVVAFDGWQWLSKTGGVRRNFGRSGGLVFARESVVADDYGLDRRSCFWFDQPGGAPVDYAATEAACDRLALRNLRRDLAEEGGAASSISAARTAYVKLSTRESLVESITRRADSVIWGLSKTPLTTLAIAAIAVVGAVANSVRSRRWQFGIMRALGTTRGAIVRIILAESVMIGIVASAASFAFGALAAKGALKLGQSMFGTRNPAMILPTEGLLLGLSLTLALCVVAALYPAIKTGRTEPLKLLQSGRSPD